MLSNWIGWSKWSKCSKSCDVGKRRQFKVCPKNSKCSFINVIESREQDCNFNECPIKMAPRRSLGKKLGIEADKLKTKPVRYFNSPQ